MTGSPSPASPAPTPAAEALPQAFPVVVLGASAGAVQALLELLPALPSDWPAALLIAVHVPPDRANALVPLLQARCALNIEEAEDKASIAPGGAWFAPSDYHLLVERDGGLALSSDEPVRHSRPSIDVLFETAADAFGPALTGIVLTGANDDGSAGLAEIVRAGGQAIVQSPDDAFAAAMPQAAALACPGARILSLSRIKTFLMELTTS